MHQKMNLPFMFQRIKDIQFKRESKKIKQEFDKLTRRKGYWRTNLRSFRIFALRSIQRHLQGRPLDCFAAVFYNSIPVYPEY